MSKVIKGSGGQSFGRGARPAARPAVRPAARGRVLTQGDQEARNQASGIVQQAQAQAEQIRAQAEEYRQKGYEDGFAAGLEEGKSDYTEAILNMNRENDKKFKHFEPEVVKLAIKIAEKIIGHEVQLHPDTIAKIVQKALGAVRHQREIFIRVNPEDYDVIAQSKPLLLDALSRAQDLDIRSDGNITRGGCRIESEIGTIEASIEKQLASIEKILLGG